MAAGKREKILIVDDAEVNRGILCEVFKDSYDVIEAENGQMALDILNKDSSGITIILYIMECAGSSSFRTALSVGPDYLLRYLLS